MRDPAEITRRLTELQEKIGIAFKDVGLLQEALSHSSFANENPSISPHDNERLEYLGDAVLQLISAEYLFKGRPGAEEGEMTQVRSSMVNTQALAALSEDLGLGEYLLLGKGIARGGGRNLRSLLANAFEAVLGAIFLDQGYDAAYHYCMERFRALPDADVPENYKGRLQHLVQERFGVTPVYDAIGARAQSGRMREYTAVVYAGGDPLGTGHGRTKQLAEQTAAREAIRKLLDATVPVAEAEALPAEAPPPQPREELTEVEEPAEIPPPAVKVEAEVSPQAASPPAPPPTPVSAQAPAPAPEPAPADDAAVPDPAPERAGGAWRSRREVAERAAAERRRSWPAPEPVPAPPPPSAPKEVAQDPPPRAPVQVPAGRQFGAPAAEVEGELVVPPPRIEPLVPAPATSRIPAQAASQPAIQRQFGTPAPEPSPQPEPAPPSRRRRATGASASAAEPTSTEKPARRRRTSRSTATTTTEDAPEEPKPARRRTTRARKSETAEPARGAADAAADQPSAPRRRTTRRRPAAQEAGPDQPA